MSSVNVTNVTSKTYSLDATVFSLQGNFQSVRASIPPASTVTVVLPAGVTYNSFALSPQVQTELSGINGTPSISIAPGPTTALTGEYGSLQVATVTQATAATVATPGLTCLPWTTKAGALLKLRILSPVASGVGESMSIVGLLLNGTEVLPSGVTCVFPGGHAKGFVDFDMSPYNILVPDGSELQVILTYVAGGAATPLANLQYSAFVTS